MENEHSPKAKPWSTAAIVASGGLSFLVLVYAAIMHSTLLLDAATDSHRLSKLMSPSMGIVHALVCVAGAAMAVTFIMHVWHNNSLSFKSRILWSVASAIGYGLVFYWYAHVLRRGPSPKPS